MGPPNEPPTAEQTAEPLHCPLCDYNLHGLPEPRCPECGYAFDWDELRASVVERKTWFFEHAQRRLMLAWIATLGAACAPWWFWREISAASKLRASRLFGWLVPLVLLVLLATAGRVLVTAYIVTGGGTSPVFYQSWSGRFRQNFSPTVAASFDPSIWLNGISAVLQEGARSGLYHGTLACLAGIPLTWAALNVFASTLRHANVKQLHIWRCAIYSWGVGATAHGLLGFVPLSFEYWTNQSWDTRTIERWLESIFVGDFAQALRLAVSILVATVCLACATRSYLRIRHPVSAAVLSQLVVALAVLGIGVALRALIG